MDLDKIVELSKRLDKVGGIDLSKLEPGTKLEVQTMNTLYKLEKLDYGNRFLLQGGKYWPTATEVHISGSTFGGSTIRLHWIGYLMALEIYDLTNKRYTTSRVCNCKIITPTYEYAMDWEKRLDPKDIWENKEE
jgi:hypothetical protein